MFVVFFLRAENAGPDKRVPQNGMERRFQRSLVKDELSGLILGARTYLFKAGE